jgi:hypothetical protein
MTVSQVDPLPGAVIPFPVDDRHGNDATRACGLHESGVEARLARLERQSLRIETLLHGIEHHVRHLQAHATELNGRVANRPTTWMMVATMLGGQLALACILVAALLLLVAPD